MELDLLVQHLALKLPEITEEIAAADYGQMGQSDLPIFGLSAENRITHITVPHIHICDSRDQ